jgi:methionyl aminopeptidase
MDLVKTANQAKHIAFLASIISEILSESISMIKPGMTTFELDQEIERLLLKHKVNGPCKGYERFPAISCLSVNSFVTHAIPDNTVLKIGDIIDIDLVIEKDGYFADVSKTVGIGVISDVASRLIKTAEECMYKAIALISPQCTLGDIGFAVQSHAETNGFSVVREYCGHFIGTAMHEGPSILNYGTPNHGLRLEAGMILCIEPMINEGRRGVISDPSGWNTRTRDGKLSSRCEHMVLVTREGHRIITKHPNSFGVLQ